MEIVTYWVQEVNADGNNTSYCQDWLSESELKEELENYSPNFEGCFLVWGKEIKKLEEEN